MGGYPHVNLVPTEESGHQITLVLGVVHWEGYLAIILQGRHAPQNGDLRQLER